MIRTGTAGRHRRWGLAVRMPTTHVPRHRAEVSEQDNNHREVALFLLALARPSADDTTSIWEQVAREDRAL